MCQGQATPRRARVSSASESESESESASESGLHHPFIPVKDNVNVIGNAIGIDGSDKEPICQIQSNQLTAIVWRSGMSMWDESEWRLSLSLSLLLRLACHLLSSIRCQCHYHCVFGSAQIRKGKSSLTYITGHNDVMCNTCYIEGMAGWIK